MTNTRCSEIGELLMAYKAPAAPLRPLERQRVAQHLDYCAACRRAGETLQLGLATARSPALDVPAEHLGILRSRLEPYIDNAAAVRSLSSRPALFGGWGAGLLLGSGALLLWWAMSLGQASRAEEQGLSPMVAVGERTPVEPDDEPSVQRPARRAIAGGLMRQRTAPGLRMLVDEDFRGALRGRRGRPTVEVDGGYAAFSFVAGPQRSLRVTTPHAVVEVVGTRFYVAVRDDQSYVGVTQGAVQVSWSGVAVRLAAGQELSVDQAGDHELLPAGEWASHAEGDYLRQLPRHARGSASETSGRRPVQDPMPLFARAESLAAGGDFAAALAVYAEVARAPHSTTITAMARYEAARLRGLKLGQVANARRTLRRLAQRAPREVRQLAALALCEVIHASDSCAGLRCLSRLKEDPLKDFGTQRQAAHLYTRWTDPNCGDPEYSSAVGASE